MHLIAGTIPDKDFPLMTGPLHFQDNQLSLAGKELRIVRGTPALMAAACLTAQTMGTDLPVGVLAGDIGTGKGSRELYASLEKNLPGLTPRIITFHYLQPILHWHERVLTTALNLPQRPILIADAGHMYIAKMSGQAARYDLFTPDAGELAFLADEEAPHPLYTRGFIIHSEQNIPELVSRACRHGNAARHLLIKGQSDTVAKDGIICARITQPAVAAMEAIGGTGDTLTGIAAALIAAGYEIDEASILAARANRLAGFRSKPTPASQISEIIANIPRSLAEIL